MAFLAGAASLLGADEARMRNIENRVTSLEQTQNTCCVINPPGRPFNACSWGVIFSIDPLIWQAHVNGLDLAIETKNSTAFFNDSGTSKVRKLDFDWDWGFRLGLGLNEACDAWDTIVYWTYWKTCGSESFTAGTNDAIYPIWGHPARTFGQVPGSTSGKWNMDYNVLDLENGREFYVSKCLTLRPFAGLRTAWIKQEFDIEYSNIPVSPNNPITPATRHDVDQKDRFWGIGIRGGLDMQWGIGCGFSVFGNYAASLLYAYHSVKHNEKAFLSEDAVQTLFRTDNFFHVGTAIFDMQLGLRYDWLSCSECWHVGFDLGWEHHFHPGQNQFMKFVDDGMSGKLVANGGDLGIMGFFFKLRLDF